jgi:crotonobetainyl-CoA:carnitine CoA-transferase CaiB-like acyl-CoA transferase
MPDALPNLAVLDFSRVLAGPFATMLLADLGATVTKVEPPGGDDTRRWGPPFDDAGDATYFQSVNRNKDSVVLNLKEADDLARARAMALDADVLVENFRPGVMDAFGLGYHDLAELNPGLIYCSITGFGRGAGAPLPGYDLLIQALGGLMSITGTPDGEPQKVGVAVVDVLSGLFATVGILAALEYRRDAGKGQRVEVNLLSALLAALVNQGSAYTIAGDVAARMGNAHPSIAPYQLFACADGELVLAVGTERQFRSVCELLGAPEVADDPRFATNSARVEHRAELRASLERQLARRPAREWAATLTELGVPAGVVNDVSGAFTLATDLGLEPVVGIPREDGTTVRLTRNPISLSLTPPHYRSPPPRFPSREADEPIPTTPTAR